MAAPDIRPGVPHPWEHPDGAIGTARTSLAADGFAHLACEITGDWETVCRPDRAMSPAEAIALLRAWSAAYTYEPTCPAPFDDPDACTCAVDCHPNYLDERVAAHFVAQFTKPLRVA